MTSRRSGIPYEHPLCAITLPHTVINFGWYSLCRASGSVKDFYIYHYRPTGFYNKNASIQSKWLGERLSIVKNCQTPDAAKAKMVDAWDQNQDTSEFCTSLALQPYRLD